MKKLPQLLSQQSQEKGQLNPSLQKREISFVFCTEVLPIKWVISFFMPAELKDQKLKATQKQI